jgi:hypothetical protein
MFSIPNPYTIALGAAAGIALIGGTFGLGYHVGHLESKVAVSQFVAKKAQVQIQYQQVMGPVTEKIVTQYVDKWHTIKENNDDNTQIAETVVPDHGQLSNGWVYLYNSSTTGTKADPVSAANSAPSGIAANQALATINDNTSTCLQWKNQLNSVLDEVEAHNKTIDTINAGKK